MGVEFGHKRVLFMHLTLVPYIATSSEMKTKPTQHSVKELRSIGIQPDVLLCRSDRPLPVEQRRKIALFTNVEERAVISAVDADDIYKIPMLLHAEGLDDIVVERFGLKADPVDLSEWEAVVDAKSNPEAEVSVALVGKYVDFKDSYISLSEALTHAGLKTRTKVNIHYVEAQKLEGTNGEMLDGMDAILIPGGFGERGVEGKIVAARYARENGVPYLGICLGMQVAVIEFARNAAGLKGAHSSEFDPKSPHPVIALITEWQDRGGKFEERDEGSDLGGTMRLGAQEIKLGNGTQAHLIYGSDAIMERHRHRFEFNNNYMATLEEAGMVFSGKSVDDLVEVIEIPEHPWFIASQFHPEFTSTPRDGHPLFSGFVKAARLHHVEALPEARQA